MAHNDLVKIKSKLSVDLATKEILKKISAKKLSVFQVIDHQENALTIGEKIKGNRVIIFGSPKMGTKLMQANPAIGLNLPLKIAIYADKGSGSIIQYLSVSFLEETYEMRGNPLFTKVTSVMKSITDL